MDTGAPKNREIDQTIGDLLEHIDFKLSTLPNVAKYWGLGEESLQMLTENLQRERALFADLPRDKTVGEVMDLYFEGSERFREVFGSLVPQDHPKRKESFG